MNRIAIVGGAGFLGTKLAMHLSQFFAVKVLDIKLLPRDLRGKVEFERCNILNYSSLARGLKEANLVIHAAVIQIPQINEAKRLGYEVNILGTRNVCEVVNQSPSIRGMILTGSWHVVGERELRGVINEEFGFRPDKVEERARFYALCKIGQETIVRIYDEMSEKVYGVIRTGTVLGMGMPEKTAAAIFVANGLKGKPLTPYKHSMYRPMLYTDLNDVCKAFKAYATKVLSGEIGKEGGSLSHIVNVCWPEPITILELAEMTRDAVIKYSNGKIRPEIEIVDRDQPVLFTPEDKNLIKADVSKVKSFLGVKRMTNPRETIRKLVEKG